MRISIGSPNGRATKSTPTGSRTGTGSNSGVSSIYALSQGPLCWLFEPNTELHECGKRLFAHNGFATARWEPVGLSDREGETRFFISQSSFLSSFDRQNTAAEGDVRYLPEPRGEADELVVKVDVEGHEMNVLAGAAAVFEAYRPATMIELLAGEGSRRAAWDWFATRGYVCFAVRDEPVLRLRAITTVGDVLASPEINFVFLPADHRQRADLESHA